MRTRSKDMTPWLPAAVIALAFVVTSAGAIDFVVRLAHPIFRIGDILRFQPSGMAESGAGTRLMVHRSDQFGCVLNLDVLRLSGGSLIIEGQAAEAGGDYRVHWAGLRTSRDSADCGSDAEIVVGSGDLAVLAAAADQPVRAEHNQTGINERSALTMR
ncbi:MAG TPA: hypothetical protein VHO91_18315 [Rhodopila sp.]|nr:hypothetical protein [Rhodopila sp.]